MSDDEVIITVQMTRGAAERFSAALNHGSAVLEGAAELARQPKADCMRDSAGWLRWGMGRITQEAVEP